MVAPSPPPVPPSVPASGAAAPRAESAADVVHAAEVLVDRAVDAAERSLALRLGQRGLRVVLFGLRALWTLAVLAFFLFCGAFLVTRYYLLPHIGDWRGNIEAAATAAVQAPVAVGHIEADWDGLNPRLLLQDVTLKDPQGANALSLPQVEVVVSWTTLLAWQPRMHSLTILAPELDIRRLADQRWTIAGLPLDLQAPSSDTTLLDWVLAQKYISVRNARVHFIDEAGPAAATGAAGTAEAAAPTASTDAPAPPAERSFDFTDVNFLLTRGLTAHHLAVRLNPPAALAGPLDLRAEFTHTWGQPTNHIASWGGSLFVQVDYADIARLDGLLHLVPAPARIDRASGALRAWVDFAGTDLQRVRADVALNDVDGQLRSDLQPLRLQKLEGRITRSQWSDRDGDTQETLFTGLRMEGTGDLRLPPTDLLVRVTQAHADLPGSAAPPAQMHVEASRMVLSDWSRLALQVPLPAHWLSLIERTAARGTLEDLRASWSDFDGPARTYALRARFSGLGFSLARQADAASAASAAADGTTPPATDTTAAAPAAAAAPAYACENLAGLLDMTQSSGTLRIDATHARLTLPGAVDDPDLAFDALSGRVRWSREGDSRTSIDVDAFSAINDDLEVNGAGSYRAGTGEAPHLDVSGHLVRARVSAVHRYLPQAMSPTAHAWLDGALLDGTVSDGSFFLHGDPAHFPFADAKNGEFHASLRVQDGRLDVAPSRPGAVVDPAHDTRWPALTSVDADVVFDRNHLTVTGRHARAFGYDLSGISARIPELDKPDQHLAIDGQGSGPLAEMLHYLAASPVNRWTGGWLGSADAAGTARLKIKLDIPLSHSVDTTVGGAVTFRNNNLLLRSEIAPFSGLNGELDFTQRGIALKSVTAGYLGGDVRLSGDTRADGSIVVQAAGSATPQGAKRQIDAALLRRVLDRTRGTLRYTATVTLQHGTMGLQVDSDLTGLAADLPEPFRKAAAEPRNLHVEIVPVAGADPARDTLRATLGSQLNVELHRIAAPADGMRIERGAVGIGARANLPESGVLLLVDGPQVDVDRWQRLLGIALPSPGAAGTPPADAAGPASGRGGAPPAGDTDAVDMVVVHTPDLILSGKSFSNVSLSARHEADQSWSADVDADQVSGSVRWIGARGAVPGRAIARLAKLAIPESDKKQVTSLLDTPPSDFPALDIVVEQLELGALKAGRLELEAQNVVTGRNNSWNVQKLVVANPDGRLTGTGSWQRDGAGAGRRMNLKFVLGFGNAGGILARFGLPGTIRNGSGKLEGDVSWHGSPFAIDYPSLAGKLHLTAEKGQFLKADAGAAGRLLGVFSLPALANRVTGDFRDIFSEGFAFDSLSANAVIANGTLSTDDFIVKGVSAAVRVKGDADLSAETQNLQVVVIPEINTGAAALGVVLVNPAIGLGTFVANYLLRKPLSAAFTKVYEITGPWSNPVVKKMSTEARVAETPDRTTP